MLKKQLRLRNNNDFKNVYKNGKRHYYGGVLLYYAENHAEHVRISCVVSKKYSLSAVKRNAQKRALLHACHESLPDIKGHFDLIFIYTNRDNMLPYKEASKALRILLQKSNLLK